MSVVSPELRRKLARIRLLATDVDGVLTDGTLYYSETGEVIKGFHTHDGLGLQRLMQAGIQVAILSGRESAPLARRIAELGVLHFFPGERDKSAIVAELGRRLELSPDQIAFVGDDLPDLPVLREVGVAIAVRDAHPEVRAQACWVTTAPGGRGAVREVADAILESKAGITPSGDEPPSRTSSGQEARLDTASRPTEFYVAVPARYSAARLPGKPLRLLAGKPLVVHTLERAKESGAREVLIATDDERVRDAVESAGGRAVMTSPDHASGTDRIAEVADREGWDDAAIVVNLQGDEPFLDGALVRRLAERLAAHPNAGMATLATPIRDPRELFDPHAAKVVLDDEHRALYFSRAPIPWMRGVFDTASGAPSQLPPDMPFLRHIGIYAYRVQVLRRLRDEKPRALEQAEMLEQLRALAMGIAIYVDVVDAAPPRGVDTEEDLARAELVAQEALRK